MTIFTTGKGFYENTYYYLKYFIYFLYIAIYLNIWSKAPSYLNVFDYFLKLFVGVTLIYIFNPFTFKKNKFNDFHREIAFSAGFFLLTATSLNAFTRNVKWLLERTKEGTLDVTKKVQKTTSNLSKNIVNNNVNNKRE